MAKKDNAKIEAVALCDLPQYSVKAGTIVSASKEFIDSLTSNGAADLHASAIAYAKAQNSITVEFP